MRKPYKVHVRLKTNSIPTRIQCLLNHLDFFRAFIYCCIFIYLPYLQLENLFLCVNKFRQLSKFRMALCFRVENSTSPKCKNTTTSIVRWIHLLRFCHELNEGFSLPKKKTFILIWILFGNRSNEKQQNPK